MQLVQSFWTAPAINNIFDINNRIRKDLIVTALSCYYAKRCGAELTMYTDDLGMQLLDHLPYDNIIVKLNDIDVHYNAYAYPKFWVMKDLPLGMIHIDNDVFIKSQKCLNELNFTDYDCIVQSKSFIKGKYPHVDIIDFYKNDLIDYGLEDVLSCNFEFNAGIVGFNNQELKDNYFRTYFDLINITKDKISEMHPDILFEQILLYHMSKNYNVKLLLHNKFEPDQIGYQHLCSNTKWDYIDIVEQLLNRYAPDMYQQTINKFEILR